MDQYKKKPLLDNGDSSTSLTNKRSKSKKVLDKKLKAKLLSLEKNTKESARQLNEAKILLPESSGYLEADEGGIEKTFKFKQSQILPHVSILASQKSFSLDLDLGPYCMDYTRNGRHVLIGGKKGHLATFDWKNAKLGCEIQVKETVRDVKWLHNQMFFAAAQKNYVYIYDHNGLEVHCLRHHTEVHRMEFLPFHFLLATVGKSGHLKYQDTSTGSHIADLRTSMGPCETMAQNSYNAIIHLGHSNGTVSMWSPNTGSTPLVKMLCHRGPVKAVAVENGGHYMATSGLDGQLKIWDIRSFKPFEQYYSPTPASSLAISQQKLLAVAYGPNISIWKDSFLKKQISPYMSHLESSSAIGSIKFCPFDDVLGLGHTNGVSSIIVPGSGEPNFDALEANPFESTKQRQTREVRSLLEKIQPELISLNPFSLSRVVR